MPNWFLVINFLSFQAIWFTAVLLGNHLALWVVAPIVLMHFLLMYSILKNQFSWKNELLLIVACVLLGVVVETVQLILPIWDAAEIGRLPPVWLLTIWVGFAISLHGGFLFLQKRFILASLLGALFAPLSYFAGAKLSPTYQLVNPTVGLLLITYCGLMACGNAVVKLSGQLASS